MDPNEQIDQTREALDQIAVSLDIDNPTFVHIPHYWSAALDCYVTIPDEVR